MEMKALNKICNYRRPCCILTPRINLYTMQPRTMRSVMEMRPQASTISILQRLKKTQWFTKINA